MSSIVTFYSFKGGVGRTMALANIAVLLARMGKSVLAVDWDLEAPGLDRFLQGYEIRSNSNSAGLLDLLTDTQKAGTQNIKPDWRDYLSYVDVGGEYPLTLLTSGRQDQDYAQKVLDFDWDAFFSNSDGGDFIEALREDWHREFDVTLIDSRTGITDSGGICTIQIPDILVPVFTTNEQSLQGAKDIALRAQQARQKLAFDRMPLLLFPLPSRFDSRTEFKEAQQWLKTFAEELGPFYDDWLPKTYTPLQIIERTKLPYIAYFSFGEKLPVVTDGVSDPEGLGYAYLAAATLIAGEFRDAEQLITAGLSGVGLISDKGSEKDTRDSRPKLIRYDEWLGKKRWRSLRNLTVAALLLFSTALLVWLIGFDPVVNPPRQPALRLHGSKTIGAELAPALAEEFFRQQGAKDIKRSSGKTLDENIVEGILSGDSAPTIIEIKARGSDTAFEDLATGACDIGLSSRAITGDEVVKLSNLGDMTSVRSEHVLALDGIAIIVQRGNPVGSLTLDQLRMIFTGGVNDWAQLGSGSGRINVYAQNETSVTRDVFQTLVLGDASLAAGAQGFESSRELSAAVADDSNGIGFVSLPFVGDAKPIAISDGDSQPLLPTRLTILSENYLLTRRLYLYTPANPSNRLSRPFVDFALSARGQDIAEKTGFINLSLTSTLAPLISESRTGQYLKLTKNAEMLPVNFRFRVGTTDLDNKALVDLDRVVDFLANMKGDKRIMLLGFSDSSGMEGMNLSLSADRANVVARELRHRGLTPSIVEGLGSNYPVASSDTVLGRERNRRVEVWLF